MFGCTLVTLSDKNPPFFANIGATSISRFAYRVFKSQKKDLFIYIINNINNIINIKIYTILLKMH